MSSLPSATTTDLAWATFSMVEALYRELVTSGLMKRSDAARVLRQAALLVAAKPYCEGAAQLIRSLPLAQPLMEP